MAVRISITPDEAYEQFKAQVRQLKIELVGETGTGGWSARLAAQDVPWTEFVRAQQMLSNALVRLAESATTPGIGQYVKDQVQDQAYDVAAEYVAMRDSIVAVRDWIYNNMPKVTSGGQSYISVIVLAQDGSMTDRVITSAQSTGLRTAIAAFKATVM